MGPDHSTSPPIAPCGLDAGVCTPAGARDALPQVYAELRELAGCYLRRERPGHTLQPTALVHEACLRLLGQREVDWNNRAQVLGLAAQMMRRILVNYASARNAEKRGGGEERLPLEAALRQIDSRPVPLPELDEALSALEVIDPRQARIVELRFFGGMTVAEVADVLEVSVTTVKREWAVAQRWLQRRMTS